MFKESLSVALTLHFLVVLVNTVSTKTTSSKETAEFCFNSARNVMRSTRGNSLKLLKPRHRLNVRGNYFANRVVNLWNSLPDSVVAAPSVDSFKRRLDKHWAALPSMYDPECLA